MTPKSAAFQQPSLNDIFSASARYYNLAEGEVLFTEKESKNKVEASTLAAVTAIIAGYEIVDISEFADCRKKTIKSHLERANAKINQNDKDFIQQVRRIVKELNIPLTQKLEVELYPWKKFDSDYACTLPRIFSESAKIYEIEDRHDLFTRKAPAEATMLAITVSLALGYNIRQIAEEAGSEMQVINRQRNNAFENLNKTKWIENCRDVLRNLGMTSKGLKAKGLKTLTNEIFAILDPEEYNLWGFKIFERPEQENSFSGFTQNDLVSSSKTPKPSLTHEELFELIEAPIVDAPAKPLESIFDEAAKRRGVNSPLGAALARAAGYTVEDIAEFKLSDPKDVQQLLVFASALLKADPQFRSDMSEAIVDLGIPLP